MRVATLRPALLRGNGQALVVGLIVVHRNRHCLALRHRPGRAVCGADRLVLSGPGAADRRLVAPRRHLCILFGLAALAAWAHVSIMLAGFVLGLVVSAVGEPHRLARQLFGITEGYFGPLFFVWLGAWLNLRELVDHPSYALLGLALGVAAVLVHALVRFRGQPLPLGALPAAQLGIPVAAATIGTTLHLLRPGEAPALILGALVITIVIASVAGGLAVRRGLVES